MQFIMRCTNTIRGLLTRHRALTNTNITIGPGSVLREETEHRHEEWKERTCVSLGRDGVSGDTWVACVACNEYFLGINNST